MNDYKLALETLEQLDDLIGERQSASGPKVEELSRDICEAYGQVADVYQQVVPPRRVQVRGLGQTTTFPNYFESGDLSGSMEHQIEGRNELRKAIGAVKTLALRAAAAADQARPARPGPRGTRVFVVHGHDSASKESVARFIERLSLPVTVLHEQPNQGRTLIEKFEAHADVAFAVVLLTRDDAGGAVTRDGGEIALRPRARQNVMFELGFFIGRLGRGRVCALFEEFVELPSDISGVAYVPLDAGGGWRLELARELKAANLPVDLQKAV